MTEGMNPWLPHRGLSLELILRHRNSAHLRNYLHLLRGI